MSLEFAQKITKGNRPRKRSTPGPHFLQSPHLAGILLAHSRENNEKPVPNHAFLQLKLNGENKADRMN
jgi:hypothetical protein